MVFLALESGAAWGADRVPALAPVAEHGYVWFYPVKIVLVAAALVAFRHAYSELKGPWFRGLVDLPLALGAGVLVYFFWVRMDWPWAILGTPRGYDPFRYGPELGYGLAAMRLLGAVTVVPVMEELFWRSFLIRYIVQPDFQKVPLGTFTWPSFFATVILFGLEHHLWLAGMMAGLVYTLVLYRTQRLWPCILAHGVTNLCLGIHVLATAEWKWW